LSGTDLEICSLDQVKRRNETRALVHKYRDPLTLAAWDLQSRCFGLVQGNLLDYAADEDRKQLMHDYTGFLFGQYLSWVYILRRQAQFMRFATDKTNKELNHILDLITDGLSTDTHRGEEAFMLWRGQQMAIGESMTLQEEQGQLYCMGFAAFAHKYQEEPEFKNWFQTINQGIGLLVHAREHGNVVATNRLRRLQHLLIDLVLLLDKERVESSGYVQDKVNAAHSCGCVGECPSADFVSATAMPLVQVV